MKFSIVICLLIQHAYQAKITKACIDNIKQFSYDYELIVIHSLKSDSNDISELLRLQDTYITYEGNKAPSACLNEGIRAAKGEYYILIGNDNFVHQNWLSEIDKRLGSEYADILACHVDRREPEKDQEFREQRKLTDYIQPTNFSYVNQQGTTIPRKIWEEVGEFDEEMPFYLYEMDYNRRLAAKGVKVGIVLDSLMTTPQNMTRIGDFGENGETKQLPEGVDNFWGSKAYSKELERYIAKYGVGP